MSWFDFRSNVEKAVDKATDKDLKSENWGLNMEIADYIERKPESSLEILERIQKRLNHSNDHVVALALSLLDVTVKNCGTSFHLKVASREALGIIVKIASKSSTNDGLRKTALSLIFQWARAFENKPRLEAFGQAYEGLISQGINFLDPAIISSTVAPIFTPPKAQVRVKRAQKDSIAASVQTAVIAKGAPQSNLHTDVSPIRLAELASLSTCSPDFIRLTMQSLRVVANTVLTFRSLLSDTDSSIESHHQSALALLKESLQQMQVRLSHVIIEVDDDDLLDVCLQVNDEIRACFEWHVNAIQGVPFKASKIQFTARALQILCLPPHLSPSSSSQPTSLLSSSSSSVHFFQPLSQSSSSPLASLDDISVTSPTDVPLTLLNSAAVSSFPASAHSSSLTLSSKDFLSSLSESVPQKNIQAVNLSSTPLSLLNAEDSKEK